MVPSELIALLDNLRLADNEARKAAEAQYDALVHSNPIWLMCALSDICATSEDAGACTISLILLRKILNLKPSPYDTADASSQDIVKRNMLNVLGKSAFGPQRGSAAACVSALAVRVFEARQDWGELWENIFNILSIPTSQDELKVVCCEIISITASIMTNFFKAHIDTLLTGLRNCLETEGKAINVTTAAFEAIIALAPLGLSSKVSVLVPLMLQVVQERLNAQDWDTAEKFSASIVEGISRSPELFEANAMQLLSGMMQVAATPSVSTSARHLAIESLISYCEEQPRIARKIPDFAASFLDLLFQYLLTVNYNDTWDVSLDEDGEELEEETDFVIGASGLDRIVTALGARKLLNAAQKLFTENISSSDWKRRLAALTLICYTAEGFANVFGKMLESLTAAILPSLHDEVKYVRAAALECLGQMSQNFGPDLQINLHSVLLPPVIQTLCDPVPRVAASGAICLNSFFHELYETDESEDEGKSHYENDFSPYIEPCCKEAVEMMHKTQHMFVREAALGMLSSLSAALKTNMNPYIHTLVPLYQEVLALPDTPDVMTCKCKAIECVTLLASNAGKEVFSPYAHGICSYLSSLSVNGMANDDPRFRFVLRGWTCMVECLKNDILPYLQDVIPLLISIMNLNCDLQLEDVQVGDTDETDKTAEDEKRGVERIRVIVAGSGEKVLKVHTALIEDKELATNILNAFLADIGASLAPYFHDLANGSVELLRFQANSSIRENGALIIDSILEFLKENNSTEGLQLAQFALSPLLNALAEEEEKDVMETFMSVLSTIVDYYPVVVTEESVCVIGEKLLATLKELIQQREEIAGKKAQEQDEDELDTLEQNDVEIQSSITSATDLISTLLEKAGAMFAPFFAQSFFPVISRWLQPNEDDFNVQRGQVVLCDFVEHAPESVAGLLPTILSTTLAFTSSRKDASLLQSNFYLINQLVQYLGPQIHTAAAGVNGADFAIHAQQALALYFASAESKTESYLDCTCNAVSAYLSMLQYFHQALVSVAPVMLESIITNLPCGGDEVEARRVHDRLLIWITQAHPVLQGSPLTVSQSIIAKMKLAQEGCLSEPAKAQLAQM